MELTVESVADIHHSGGTILASSRGGFECDRIIGFLQDNRINQLYVIGGDGTHRGANKIAEECLARQLNIAVVGIPKTIDNDVDLIDRSFGEHLGHPYLNQYLDKINLNLSLLYTVIINIIVINNITKFTIIYITIIIIIIIIILTIITMINITISSSS